MICKKLICVLKTLFVEYKDSISGRTKQMERLLLETIKTGGFNQGYVRGHV